MLSTVESYGIKGSYKYYIGYIDHDIIPLKIKFPKMTARTKYFHDNKCFSFIANDKNLLQKYNSIWDKISNLLDENLYSEPVYYNNRIKTKVKIYKNKVFTNFQNNTIESKLESVLINSEKKYYQQVV